MYVWSKHGAGFVQVYIYGAKFVKVRSCDRSMELGLCRCVCMELGLSRCFCMELGLCRGVCMELGLCTCECGVQVTHGARRACILSWS